MRKLITAALLTASFTALGHMKLVTDPEIIARYHRLQSPTAEDRGAYALLYRAENGAVAEIATFYAQRPGGGGMPDAWTDGDDRRSCQWFAKVVNKIGAVKEPERLQDPWWCERK